MRIITGGAVGVAPVQIGIQCSGLCNGPGRTLGAGGIMLAFGLGTLPTVLTTGFAAALYPSRLLQRRPVRIGMALLIILFGCWTLIAGGQGHRQYHSHAHPPVDSTNSAVEDHPHP